MKIVQSFLFSNLFVVCLTAPVLFPIEHDEIGSPCTNSEGQKGLYQYPNNCNSEDKTIVAYVKFAGTVTCCVPTLIARENTREQLQVKAGVKSTNYCNEYGFKKNVALTFHIVDGEKSDAGEFPYMAALGLVNNVGEIDYDCGGAVISDKFMVTAAHCVDKKNQKPKTVRLGRTSLNLNDTDDPFPVLEVGIKRIIAAPEYSASSKYDDIALIEFSEKIAFTQTIKPICLQTDNDEEETGRNLTIIGFGATNYNTRTKSDWLLKATVKDIPVSECQKEYKPVGLNGLKNGILNTQLCARDDRENRDQYADSCLGDSGSPMTVLRENKYYLVGLVSFGLGCGSKFPSVYTRISNRIPWIENIVWPA